MSEPCARDRAYSTTRSNSIAEATVNKQKWKKKKLIQYEKKDKTRAQFSITIIN
jgi:hypothetical protein